MARWPHLSALAFAIGLLAACSDGVLSPSDQVADDVIDQSNVAAADIDSDTAPDPTPDATTDTSADGSWDATSDATSDVTGDAAGDVAADGIEDVAGDVPTEASREPDLDARTADVALEPDSDLTAIDDLGGPAPTEPPDHSHVIDTLAAERPDLLSGSCVEAGGSNEFLFESVRRLRDLDPRWGLNWKRGVVGDLSQDVVDYFRGTGEPEGSTEVFIIDMITGHCGDAPSPGWIDVTQATVDAGTVGRWTLAGRSDL